MEEIPPARRSGKRRLVVAAGIAAAVAALAWFGLHRISSAPLTVAGVPRINLAVSVIDREGAPAETTPTPTADRTPASADFWRPRPTPTLEPAERDESIELARAPIAVSVYVLDGGSLLAWASSNPSARAILDSELVQGMSKDVLRAIRVRGEDLKLQGVQGPFLDALARDVISANAVIHYDHSRGRRGYVLAFERGRSSLAGRLLPLIVGAVGKREYRVGSLGVSIIEIVLGPQRLFVTERGGEVYLGSSVAALLNLILESPPPPSGAQGTIAVTARAEAWLRDLVPATTGQDHFDLTWTADLREKNSPGEIRAGSAEFFGLLQPSLDQAVLSAMPRDAFAVVAASVPFPHAQASDDRQRFEADPGAKSAGIAIAWDFELTDKLRTQVGVAALARRDEEQPALASLVSDGAFSDQCAGGAVLLAATSELLLTRMREACNGQSIGLDDRIPAGNEAPQIVLAVAAGDALVQVLDRGIGVAKEERISGIPNDAGVADWRKKYDEAVEHARDSAVKTLAALPNVVFTGRATNQGAVLKGAFEPPKKLARRVP
jgi:hypothetical protein